MKRISVFLAFLLVPVWALAKSLTISPADFDFGWAPQMAQINADFLVTNPTQEIIPVTEVSPACGCTAAEFQPEKLSSDEEMKIRLTFNTAGYDHRSFNKRTRVKSDFQGEEYYVYLKGQVINKDSLLRPEGSGVVQFEREKLDEKKSLLVHNKLGQDVFLTMVQAPDDWVTLDLPDMAVPSDKPGVMEISIDPKDDSFRKTSATFEAILDGKAHRFTVAIRIGASYSPSRRILKAPEKKDEKKPAQAN